MPPRHPSHQHKEGTCSWQPGAGEAAHEAGQTGTNRAEAAEGAVRKPPHRQPLTLPCISSRMVRVTFRPPSETFDSISYQGMGDVC